MLKGISPLLSPDLLYALAAMGHGDEIVIGDGNFPADSMGKRCIRADGHGVNELLDAILQLFPLDTFVEAPVTLLSVVPGTGTQGDPPIWSEFRKTIDKYDPNAKIGFEERFAFYDRARRAYATIQTGETALYGCVMLTKGVLK